MQTVFSIKEMALKKIKNFCAYQERSHYETNRKLYHMGIPKPMQAEIIADLIEQGFLNEERFATVFAGGKFRIKHWGKVKIKQALAEKKVSKQNIQIALNTISTPDYLLTLQRLASKKWESLPGNNFALKNKKTYDYLLQKGYEQPFIHAILKKIEQTNNKL